MEEGREPTFTVTRYGPILELRRDGRWYRNGEPIEDDDAYWDAIRPLDRGLLLGREVASRARRVMAPTTKRAVDQVRRALRAIRS